MSVTVLDTKYLHTTGVGMRVIDSDPSVSPGLVGLLGDLAIALDSGRLFNKWGAGNTDWSPFGFNPGPGIDGGAPSSTYTTPQDINGGTP